MRLAPTWLLFDADWAHTKQAAPYLRHCSHIVSVGRVHWMAGTQARRQGQRRLVSVRRRRTRLARASTVASSRRRRHDGPAKLPVLADAPLPALLDRAARQLVDAKSAAEILVAKQSASKAYDAAKAEARFEKARGAHFKVMATAYLTQAEALRTSPAPSGGWPTSTTPPRRVAKWRAIRRAVRESVPDGNDSVTAADAGIVEQTLKKCSGQRRRADQDAAAQGHQRRPISTRPARRRAPPRSAPRRLRSRRRHQTASCTFGHAATR